MVDPSGLHDRWPAKAQSSRRDEVWERKRQAFLARRAGGLGAGGGGSQYVKWLRAQAAEDKDACSARPLDDCNKIKLLTETCTLCLRYGPEYVPGLRSHLPNAAIVSLCLK